MVVSQLSKESRLMIMAPERTKPLHNFKLPTSLKWGNQRFLRCMKVNSNGEILSSSDPDRRSSGSDADSDGKDFKFTKQTSGVKSKIGEGEFREKLMLHLPIEKRKIILPEEDESAVATASRPWNLRTRRAACKAPNGSSKLDERQQQYQHQSVSPQRSEYPSPKSLRLKGLASMATNQAMEKKERCKFSTSLTRDEIKEDIFLMTGNNLPRRPKKRPRIVQKQLDNLFPGFWLTEVTTDSYKVPDELVETKKK